MFPTVPLNFGVSEWLLLLALLFIGIIIIVASVKVILFVLPAAIIALVVWLVTGNGFLAGIAFVAVAVLSILKR
jgi:hypothetical protein